MSKRTSDLMTATGPIIDLLDYYEKADGTFVARCQRLDTGETWWDWHTPQEWQDLLSWVIPF